ncbi:MAG: cytochrome c family protein [Lacunisphaera sp.]|nr:cytochrome c family protein [Lacunisphaera sp.]
MSTPIKSGAFSVYLAAGLATAVAADSAVLRDIENGRRVFATCAACHDPGLPTKTGPDLRGVVGRKSGTVPGFRYSRAMKNARIVWDEATLDAYLAEPQEMMPGNAMPFPGLPLPADRRDLIAYLKTYTP